MKEIEIYGVCTEVVRQDDVYRITLKDDEGKTYKVSASEYDVHWEILVGRHYYVHGTDEGDLGVFGTYVDRWGRYCDHCGKHHTEGYYVNEDMYACSDECGYALCGGEKQFRATIWLDEDGELDENSPTYWTEWEC